MIDLEKTRLLQMINSGNLHDFNLAGILSNSCLNISEYSMDNDILIDAYFSKFNRELRYLVFIDKWLKGELE